MTAEPQKILCPCGSQITLRNKTQHEKSQKHLIGMTKASICDLNENEPVKDVIKKLSNATLTDDDFKKQVLTRLEYILEVLTKVYDGVEGLYDEDEDAEGDEVDEVENQK